LTVTAHADSADPACWAPDDSPIEFASATPPSGCVSAGFEFVFLRPQWESNLAFTTLEANGLGDEWISDTELDHDFAVSPRLWFGYGSATGIGVRGRYWEFDQAAPTAIGAAPANGFGKVEHHACGLRSRRLFDGRVESCRGYFKPEMGNNRTL
jgi:hypothetical protein